MKRKAKKIKTKILNIFQNNNICYGTSQNQQNMEKNKLLKEIHKIRKTEEENKAQEIIKEIEKHANDSRRMFHMQYASLKDLAVMKHIIVESQ